jgi:hypothetical protein
MPNFDRAHLHWPTGTRRRVGKRWKVSLRKHRRVKGVELKGGSGGSDPPWDSGKKQSTPENQGPIGHNPSKALRQASSTAVGSHRWHCIKLAPTTTHHNPQAPNTAKVPSASARCQQGLRVPLPLWSLSPAATSTSSLHLGIFLIIDFGHLAARLRGQDWVTGACRRRDDHLAPSPRSWYPGAVECELHKRQLEL